MKQTYFPKDWQEIEFTLKRYSNIYLLEFDMKKIMDCGNSDEKFVFREILKRDKEKSWAEFLKELDFLIGCVGKVYSKKKLRDKINCTPFSTKFELEIANLFATKKLNFSPDFQTEGKSNVDFKLSLGNKEIFVEAYIKYLGDKDFNQFRETLPIIYACLSKKISQNKISNNLSFPLILATDRNYNGYMDMHNFNLFYSKYGKEFSIFSGSIIKEGSSFNFIANPFAKNSLTQEQQRILGENEMKNNPKNGWKEVELREICEIKKGSSITKDKVTDGDVPVVAGGQQPAYYHNLSNRTGPVITVSGSGAYAGFVNYFEIPIFASDCSTIQPKNENIFCKFIYFLMKSKQNEIYKMQKGIAQPHVYPKDLEKISFLLPPLPVQKKIVSILEKAEKLKQKREEADKLTNEYLKSVFNEMFYNKAELRKLKEVAEISMGQSPPGESYNENEEGIPFFQGKAEFTDKYPVVKKWTNQPTKYAFPNSILISVRAPVGSVNLCNIKCCIGRGLASITAKKETTLEYLYSWFKVNEEQIANLGTGSTFKAISSSQLTDLEIPLPPLSLQQKFAKVVEKVEKLKERQKDSKEKINEMFDALMQKAFRGELK